jgi:hypothetical protein
LREAFNHGRRGIAQAGLGFLVRAFEKNFDGLSKVFWKAQMDMQRSCQVVAVPPTRMSQVATRRGTVGRERHCRSVLQAF